MNQHCLPSCIILISSEPIIRRDDAKASFTIKNLIDKLRKLNIKQIFNGNITTDHISKKGLHLNAKGTGRLALNITTNIRRL